MCVTATAIGSARWGLHTMSVLQELCEGGELEKTLGKSHYSERTVRFCCSSPCAVTTVQFHLNNHVSNIQ